MDQGLASSLHIKSEDFQFHLKRNRGFDYAKVTAISQALPELPPFLPVVEPHKWLANVSLAAAAVKLKRVVSANELSTESARTVRDQLHMAENAKLVLLSFAKDQLLEDIDRARETVLSGLANAGFDLIASLDYSVYDSRFPPERMNNQMRSLISFEILQSAGAVAVPHLAWSNQRDIERLARWLWDNRTVRMIALDLQSSGKRSGTWKDYLVSLQQFAFQAPPVAYFVAGVADPRKIYRPAPTTSRHGAVE